MTNIAVEVNRVGGPSATMTVAASRAAAWTRDDARRFVWDVWRRLLAAAMESLQLRELTPYGTWRLEFVADTGTAVTGPLCLSDRALEWLQSAVFNLPAARPVH
jgi:hypothetical protein